LRVQTKLDTHLHRQQPPLPPPQRWPLRRAPPLLAGRGREPIELLTPNRQVAFSLFSSPHEGLPPPHQLALGDGGGRARRPANNDSGAGSKDVASMWGGGGLSRALADGSRFPHRLPPSPDGHRVDLAGRRRGSWSAGASAEQRQRPSCSASLLPMRGVEQQSSRDSLSDGGGEAQAGGSCKCVSFFPCCWRRWDTRGMKNTVQRRQMTIYLPNMLLIVGLNLRKR
jgi:hypothetical protein